MGKHDKILNLYFDVCFTMRVDRPINALSVGVQLYCTIIFTFQILWMLDETQGNVENYG